MRIRLLLAFLTLSAQIVAAYEPDLNLLLLTPQRLKRLKRDRERQTDRWLAFEQRIQENANSPQRGLELAMYYAVTGDADKGRAAIAWTLGHACETLSLRLITAATADLQSPEQGKKLRTLTCADKEHPLEPFGLQDPAIQGDEFLLSLRPASVEHPTWQQHVAALLLVTLDPNSRPAQFLQGWAMEDRFTLRQGSGVVYEFLYANPYLPGVSYQNMAPWVYSTGTLWARSDWSPSACWVHVNGPKREAENCPPELWSQPLPLAGLVLLPVEKRCIELPEEPPTSTILLTNLEPLSKVTYQEGEKQKTMVDKAGLWRVPAGVTGKVCTTH
jgi:hypothetical protein